MALVSALPLLSGCSTFSHSPKGEEARTKIPKDRIVTTITEREQPKQNFASPWNPKGSGIARVGSERMQYLLEEAVLYGERFVIANNDSMRTNELPHRLYKADEMTLVINPQTKEVIPKVQVSYVPEQVLEGNGEVKHHITLRDDGVYSTKAKMAEFPDKKRTALGLIARTEQSVEFEFKPVLIRGEPYFVAYWPAKNEDFLNLGLIPVGGTKYEVAPNGQVSFDSENGVYRFRRTPENEYSARQPKSQQSLFNLPRGTKVPIIESVK